MNKKMMSQLFWILGAAALGFSVSAIFSGWLQLPRSVFLIFYSVFTAIFLFAFFKYNNLDFIDIVERNWPWGLIIGVLLSVFLVKNIYSQPASPGAEGLGFVLDMIWLGIVYGLIDALLLSVLPALAVWNMDFNSGVAGKISCGILIMIASLFVTSAYHLGFKEYRGRNLISPTIGNGMMTLGYVISGNPLSATLSHMAMHIAGVARGPESVKQLPPHY